MDCGDVRSRLLDYQRGRLEPSARGGIRGHLEGCAACTHEADAEAALTEVLEQRLPQHAAPVALKRRLAAEWPATQAPSWWRRWGRSLVPALAVAAVLLVVVTRTYEGVIPTRNGSAMVAEAVNDHLRILTSRHQMDIECGGMHEVKPWFEGRLDFAPVVSFLGDEEFPLEGGAVGYFLDRKAAVFVFHRRRHAISLLVFRADGLPWPARRTRIARVDAHAAVARGFTVILWRNDELGYALISDVDGRELTQLAAKLAGGA